MNDGAEHRTTSGIVDDCSLEVGARAVPGLVAAAPEIRPGSTIAIPCLPGQDDAVRLLASQSVRALGFAPMPHLCARRIVSRGALDTFVGRAVDEAGVDRVLVIAGDPSTPSGSFEDSLSLIETGTLERAGIRIVAVGAHPEAHPVMDTAARWEVLARKCHAIEARGMAPLIVTQFVFDADIVLDWLVALRARGLRHPVRVGVPGPAGVAALVRYAAMCGVGASASMLSRYGVSIGRLVGSAGPDILVERLVTRLTAAHGQVGLHVYPFGGIARSAEWIAHSRARSGHDQLRPG